MTRQNKSKLKFQKGVQDITDFYQHAPCGYHSLDKDGIFIRINSTELEWLGYTEEELVGRMHFPDLLTPDSKKVFESNFPKFKELGYVHDLEFDIITKNRSNISVMVNATAVIDKNGEYLCSRSIVFNITNLKRLENDLLASEHSHAEIALAESERNYRLLFLNNPQPMWIYDLETLAFLEVNDAAVDHYGYSHDEFLKMTLKDIRPAEDIPLLLEDVARTYKTLNPAGSWRHQKKSGEIIQVEIISHTTVFNERSARHVMVIDVTAQKNLEKELIEAKEKAEQSDRLKSAFLANMSHEIRTPLNGILGFTGLITEDEDLTPELRKEYSVIINRNANTLIQIIDDILDISKLETGQMAINKTEFCLQDTLQILQRIFLQKLADLGKKNIEFRLLQTPPDLEILTDSNRLIQIFTNLLDNSIKFTTTGVITFGVHQVTKNEIWFIVSDTGIGIPEEKQELVFERFTQAEFDTSYKYGGSGLGLSIVKKLINLMGGRILVKSEVGKGSEFKFSLPR